MRQSILTVMLTLATASSALADTQIQAKFSFRYDRIRPNPQSGIVVNQTVNATLSGEGNVSDTRIREAGRASDQKRNTKVLGAESGALRWEVLDANKLRRTVNAPQSVQFLTITVNGNTCTLDVVFKLKPGFREYQFNRITDGTTAYFTQPMIQSTSCTIR